MSQLRAGWTTRGQNKINSAADVEAFIGHRQMEIGALWQPMNDLTFCIVGGTDQNIKLVK